MRTLYITTPGKLVRKENTLYFTSQGHKKPLPVETIQEIFILSPVSVSSQVLNLLSKKGIVAHFFDIYGNYNGTFWPRNPRISGDLVIRQVEHYTDEKKRLFIAKRFVIGSIKNMNRTLVRYDAGEMETTCEGSTVKELMGCEGIRRREYYEKLDSILPEEFKIEERVRRPPNNRGNALISFGNSLLYGVIVSELYKTPLHPGISYLHEPFERRFSLALDIADIFKPLIVDRLVVFLVNKRIIKKQHFREDLGGILLNDTGKRIFLSYWDRRLRETIKHRKLKRKVSYRRLIRLELLKLIKHLLGVKRYDPFVAWW